MWANFVAYWAKVYVVGAIVHSLNLIPFNLDSVNGAGSFAGAATIAFSSVNYNVELA